MMLKRSFAVFLIGLLLLSFFAVFVLLPVVYADTLYEFNTQSKSTNWGFNGVTWLGQSFTVGATAHTVETISINSQRSGASGIVTVSIRATNASGYPILPDLTSGTQDDSSWSNTTYAWNNITVTKYTLSANTIYAVIVRIASPAVLNWATNSVGTYSGGFTQRSVNSGVDNSWVSTYAAWDNLFQIYGNPSDSTPPTFSGVATNTTLRNTNWGLNITLADETALANYTFGCNFTGTWINDSAVVISGTSYVVSVTKTSSAAVGDVDQWEVWFADSSNNLNNTGILSNTTTAFTVSYSSDSIIQLSHSGYYHANDFELLYGLERTFISSGVIQMLSGLTMEIEHGFTLFDSISLSSILSSFSLDRGFSFYGTSILSDLNTYGIERGFASSNSITLLSAITANIEMAFSQTEQIILSSFTSIFLEISSKAYVFTISDLIKTFDTLLGTHGISGLEKSFGTSNILVILDLPDAWANMLSHIYPPSIGPIVPVSTSNFWKILGMFSIIMLAVLVPYLFISRRRREEDED